MKCLVCDRQVDELREFPVVVDAQGKTIEDAMGKFRHQQELSAWTHVTLTAQRGGGSLTLLSGHVCPDHVVAANGFELVAAGHPRGDET